MNMTVVSWFAGLFAVDFDLAVPGVSVHTTSLIRGPVGPRTPPHALSHGSLALWTEAGFVR
jgi:hypothetical protein